MLVITALQLNSAGQAGYTAKHFWLLAPVGFFACLALHQVLGVLAIGLSAALSVFAFAGPARAQASARNSVKVEMVVWRGCEEACRGFIRYFEDRDLPVQIDVMDVNRDRDKLAEVREQIVADQPDLVVTWGTSVSLGIFGVLCELWVAAGLCDFIIIKSLLCKSLLCKSLSFFSSISPSSRPTLSSSSSPP